MIPRDACAFVARAELATNSNDPEWPLTEAYAPEVRLELIGDGVHQVCHGIAEAGPAVRALYDWIAASRGRVTKTLIGTSPDTIVNEVEGRLFNGRHVTRGTEIWRFDEHGRVVHNVIYSALDAKPPTNPAAALRVLIGHPRVALTYLAAQLREHRRVPGRATMRQAPDSGNWTVQLPCAPARRRARTDSRGTRKRPSC